MEDFLKNRFAELAERAEKLNTWTETDFLSMAEQDTLLSMRLGVRISLFGGYENAERRIGIFGSEDDIGYPYESEICCVRISPAMQKFAEQLAHRDILGALMSLGIDRKATGDILIIDNVGYLFCLKSIAPYIIDNLSSVRHTAVRLSLCEPPEKLSEPPRASSVNIASERLDALISAVYKLGRTAAKDLVSAERVYVNGRLAANADATLPEGCIVSVRGYGRFRYDGILKTTRKGRLAAEVRIY